MQQPKVARVALQREDQRAPLEEVALAGLVHALARGTQTAGQVLAKAVRSVTLPERQVGRQQGVVASPRAALVAEQEVAAQEPEQWARHSWRTAGLE